MRNVVVTTYFFDFRPKLRVRALVKMIRPAVFGRAGSGIILCGFAASGLADV